ncbi:MAG: sulfurtransferase TusA family protein [Actinomycetia bacterium]|nr:sulfurtransferase TusA family protein [Actinomycetes bacterium]
MASPSPPSHPVTCDVRALACPFAVLEVKRQVAALPPGAVVEVLSADAWTALDVEVWARRAGHGVERPNATTVLLLVRRPVVP